jgi:manganese oxidase
MRKLFSRRAVLQGAGGLVAASGAAALLGAPSQPASAQSSGMAAMDHSATMAANHAGHGANMTVGVVNPITNGFDPMQMLVDWDYGKVSRRNGQTVREYEFIGVDKEIEIVPGVKFPAWTYNGRVPGPSIRCTEGDRIRVVFKNEGSHPHTIHFHGIHPAEMDGTPLNQPMVKPGEQFIYDFTAEPYGCHLYHCHANPLKRHIHKGMYGAFIIDPKGGRPPAREFMMMMNAFDTNFDGANEVYAVNTVGFEFAQRPIPIQVGELVRIYLINVLEFDLMNSFHLHANMFDYYDHGTTLTPTLKRVDTISQMQGQRGILELKYKYPGQYMFHPHVSEFTELGWMGHFNVVKPADYAAALQAVGMDAAWDKAARSGSTVVYDPSKNREEL